MTEVAWGEQLFFHHRCATCHDINGSRRTGPPLNGRFGSEVTLSDGSTVPFDEAYFRESLLEPHAKLARGYPPQMPSYKGLVNAAQLDAMAQYLSP